MIRKLALPLIVAAIVGSPFIPAIAHSAEPYGGCDEAWRYPTSQGATDCRRAGWTIRPHFAIDPTNHLRATDFGPCKFEDDHGCFWNALRRGNHTGNSYVTSKRGEVFYVAGWR